MKKYLKYVLSLFVLTAFIFGGIKLYSTFNNKKNESMGFALSFDSLNALSNKCSVIAKVTIGEHDPNFQIKRLGSDYYKYPLTISKLIKNNTDLSEEQLKEMPLISLPSIDELINKYKKN